MPKITETDIELFAIEELEALGYHYLHGSSIAPDEENAERQRWDEVLLKDRLRSAIYRINQHLPHDILEDALKTVSRIQTPELIVDNEQFHKYMTDGIEVVYRKDGQQRGDKVWLIDFEKPENNEFLVVNQFSVKRDPAKDGAYEHYRPDIVLFINGIPLVVIELKNPAVENATVKSAFKQLQTYKETIPGLFTYNAFMVASDGLEARAGTVSSGFSRFMAWKTADGKTEASSVTAQLETLINGKLNKNTLLDLVRHFIVFEKLKKEDKKGITRVETVKKLAAYHQYYAVNSAVTSTIKAASDDGSRKGGVVWHTQGSGKSLSMVFYTGKLVLQLDNPTVVVITDRNDLDDQLFDTFADSTQLLRQTPVQTASREKLKELLKVASGGIVFTTIQKFFPEKGNQYEQLSDRKNIVVIADEAHRTQYGFKARAIETKDSAGQVVGQKIAYGFAKYMRDALPNATYIGFTGTPIEKEDKNTPAVFGDYIDIYDIARAVEDKATVPNLLRKSSGKSESG